jgi:DNA-binding transcriptional ArsR family regulator
VTGFLRRATLTPGIGFTVILHPGTWRAAPPPDLNATALRVYDALAAGRKTVAALQAALGLRLPNLRKALRALAANGLVQQHGGRGQATWYDPAPTARNDGCGAREVRLAGELRQCPVGFHNLVAAVDLLRYGWNEDRSCGWHVLVDQSAENFEAPYPCRRVLDGRLRPWK